MPTNLHHGFFLCPVDLDGDEDFQTLSAEQAGVWWYVMRQCYRNPDPWTWRGEPLPAFSMTTTYARIARKSGIPGAKSANTKRSRAAEQKARRAVAAVKEAGWIRVASRERGHTVICLLKATRWQSFETYRVTAKKQAPNKRRTGGETITLSTPSTSPTEKKPVRSFPDDHPGWEIARAYYLKATEAGALRARGDFETSTLLRWVDELDKLHRIDKQPWDLIRRVCEWLPTDRDDANPKWTGWWNKATPGTFRKKDGDGQAKFDKLVRAMGGSARRWDQVSPEEARRQAEELDLPLG
jgi:hypothetical protein